MAYTPTLFFEDELSKEDSYTPPQDGLLFGDDSVESQLSSEILDQFRQMEVSVLDFFPEWGEMSAFLKRKGLRTLYDAVHLRPDKLAQVKCMRTRYVMGLQRLQKDILKQPEHYVAMWEEKLKPVEVPLADFFDLPTAISALHGATVQATEIWKVRQPKGELIHEFMKSGLSIFDFHNQHPDLTLERHRQIIVGTMRSFAMGEMVAGVTLSRTDSTRLQAMFQKNLYHCFPASMHSSSFGLYLSLFNMDMLAPSAANDSWDFIMIVGANEVMALRTLLTAVLNTLSRIQLPATADELVEKIHNLKIKAQYEAADRDGFVRNVLRFHPWVEHLDGDRYRLATTRLSYVVERLGRIIYDKGGPVKISEVLDIYERTFGDRVQSANLFTLQKRWDGYVCHGRTGYWEYDPSAVKRLSLNEQLREWINDKRLPDVFSLADVRRLMDENGLKMYRDTTVRAYLSAHCSTCLDDDTLFCMHGHTDEHPEHRWRQSINVNAGSELATALYDFLMLHPNHEAYAREVTDYLMHQTPNAGAKAQANLSSRLSAMVGATEEEAIEERNVVYRIARYGMSYLKLNEKVTREECERYSFRRHSEVQACYEALYAFARAELSREGCDGRMRMARLLHLFCESDAYAALSPEERRSELRLRSAFNENVLPSDFERLKLDTEDGRSAIFVQLKKE